MNLLRGLLQRLGRRPAAGRAFILDDDLLAYVERLAEAQARPVEQVLAELLAGAVEQRDGAAELRQRWDTLTRREQQAAALVCQGCSYQEIAGRMFISSETVKTHLSRAYAKLGVRNAGELRAVWAAIGERWDGGQ